MSKLVLDAILVRLDALERRVLGRARSRVTKAEKARREGVSTRTITRRVDAGLLEQPEIINGRWYFWVDEAGESQRGIAHTNTTVTDTAAARAARNPRLRKPAHSSPET
jgi:hypothetical protein